ncbi:ARID domain-containing protein [Cephalotus follicularis]|uniref:ARID domain-containing protein n=1 Tax=Cephalotus follicularis TaxID=3775 RepID=A0A1Q3CXM4_CEPFO|nr:ARID domain-containing protein [Cephalotus follicularis]
MSGGEVGDTKEVKQDTKLTLDINLSHTVGDGVEPDLTLTEVDQVLKMEKEVNADEGSKSSVDNLSLVESAAACQTAHDTINHANVDGLDGDDVNVRLGSQDIDNDGHDLASYNQGLSGHDAAKSADDSLMIVDANGTNGNGVHPLNQQEEAAANESSSRGNPEDDEKQEELKVGVTAMELSPERIRKEKSITKLGVKTEVGVKSSNQLYHLKSPASDDDESGTEEEQASFRNEVEAFYKERGFEFKAPKFYKEELNLLKLWRAVIKLGGYKQVTSCKLWRNVGESFKPPKTCTTVSWTFRNFYEKALLDYENHKIPTSELPLPDDSEPSRVENQAGYSQDLGSGRVRRDSATRAMQGWHTRRVRGNGEVCHPLIKDKNSSFTPKGHRQPKSNGLLKHKISTTDEHSVQAALVKAAKRKSDNGVVDIGPPADWVKINVHRTDDCFEIYALVPGFLREEVHVQTDAAGRLVISGQPKQLDNPWGVTPFSKVVVSLPCRIDPHQASAVVTMHGQLFVRVPFEQSDV